MSILKVDQNTELRLLKPEYTAEIAAAVMDSFDELSPWLPWVDADYSANVTRKFIQVAQQQFAEQKGLQAAIFVDNRLAGGIGFNNIDVNNSSAEIGYWLNTRFVGKGSMTRCCAALIEFGFEEFGLNRIVIRCATENTRSQAIPLRLGFTEEGVQREAEKLNGKFVDLRVFSLLAAERSGTDHKA